MYDKLHELSPGYYYGNASLGNVYLSQGRLGRALTSFEKETDPESRLTGLAMVHHALEDPASSDEALKRLIDDHGADSPVAVASVYAYRGEIDTAFEWLDRALARRDSSLSGVRVAVPLRPLQDDPRWVPLLEKIGFVD